MDLSVVSDVAAWDAIAGEWNDLLRRSAHDTPFLRHEFLRTWWETLGGGEWPDGELWIVLGRDPRGPLVAAAPLFRTSARPSSLLLIGTTEIADYLDVLAAPEDAERFTLSLLRQVDEGGAPGIDTLDLWNLLETSASVSGWEAAGRAVGWRVERVRLQPCPRISLAGGWEDYLGRLDRKQRHELRRKMRRVGELGTAAFVRAGVDRDRAEAVEAFLRLMEHDRKKAGFLTEPMRRTFHEVARVADEGGWLHLELLEIAGEPAAGVFAFDYDDRLWLYNSGLNPEHLALSPGWVLLGHLIQFAAAGGRRELDFLRGGEDYKFRLGGEPRYVERLTLSRA